MADAATLAALQRQIARLERSSPLGVAPPVLACGHREIDGAFAGGGLRPGAHQFASGADDPGAATAFAVLLLARALARPDVQALVVQEVSDLREAGAAYGPGLHALGIDPARLAFLAAPNGAEALRAVNDALALRAAEVVLLGLRRDAGLADLSVTRRFNLAAERGGAWVLLATPDLLSTSAALSRWTVASAPSAAPRAELGRLLGAPAFDLELLRNRHGRLGRWRAEPSCPKLPDLLRSCLCPYLCPSRPPPHRKQPCAAAGCICGCLGFRPSGCCAGRARPPRPSPWSPAAATPCASRRWTKGRKTSA